MAYPLPVTEQPLQPPASRPLLAIGLLRDAAGASSNYTSGAATGSLLRYPGLDSFAWWVDPDLSAPVRVHLSEDLTGVFADPQIDVTYLPVDAAGILVGDRRGIDPDIRPGQIWYDWRVSSRTDAAGLVTLTGETLLARLARMHPREILTIVAGEGGAPSPLTLQECLRRFLAYYGVPHDPASVPPFVLRTGEDVFAPTVPAFVIRPNEENPESILDWLDTFFAPFRGYSFRADSADQLVVTSPAWLETLGLRLNAFRRWTAAWPFLTNRGTVASPWVSARPPLVAWEGSVNGVRVSGSLPDPLVKGDPPQVVQLAAVGSVSASIEWAADDQVRVVVTPTPSFPIPLPVFEVSFLFTIEPDTTTDLVLLPSDLAPDSVVTIDADGVVNQATVRIQAIDWQTNQQVMQAAAMVLKSPPQLAAGSFGHNFEYGPMTEDLVTPGGFLELVNDAVQSGTWFWPVDDAVVLQPGGNITVAYEVEEWAEMWGHNKIFLPQPAEQVNTHSGTVELPANGSEVLLFSLQFPRRTWATSIGGYQAQGRVHGRWRAGENPGVEIRVGNSRFAEYGFLWEGLGGQTVYFLWGAVVKLNGTGTTFTTGATTVHRFGYAQNDDGTWEINSVVPALAESQAAYPSRSLEVTLPYPLTEEQAISIARGIVEENLHPRAVHQLDVVPNVHTGWPITPADLGRVVSIPSLHLRGRVKGLAYDEVHAPSGSMTNVTVEVEEIGRIPGTSSTTRLYGRAKYTTSSYQRED